MAAVSSVDAQLLARTRNWLYSKQRPAGGWAKPDAHDDRNDRLTTAYIAWALATASSGSPDPRLANVLGGIATSSDPEGDNSYALALRANALLAGKRADAAHPIVERLAAAALRDDRGVHWTSKEAGVLYSSGPSLDVEVTGLAAHALMLAGIGADLSAGALDWIVASRNSYGTWSTTQATIAAMRALLDAARPTPKEAQEIRIEADRGPPQRFTLTPADRDVHRLISLRELATTGVHSVELQCDRRGRRVLSACDSLLPPVARPRRASRSEAERRNPVSGRAAQPGRRVRSLLCRRRIHGHLPRAGRVARRPACEDAAD